MAKRTRITRPYPTHSIQDALPIAATIQRVNGGQPVETELLAEALGTSARSSAFIQKLNSSSKYGLTTGSYSDEFIRLTELGESATAPGSAEEREASILEAATKPEVFRNFYRIYAGKRMPEDIYASNTLTRELGVPRELTEECLGIIRRNGLVAGVVSDRAGVLMVGSIADSEEAARYRAQDPDGLETERVSDEGEREDSEGLSESGADVHILIVSERDEPIRGEVAGLLDGLSVSGLSVNLDMSGGRMISRELSEGLASARGCVFVWPRGLDAGDYQAANPRIWAALGALSYRLGKRLIVVFPDGDDDSANPLANDPGATAIRVSHGESVYPKLMAALVGSEIVRVSVG